MTERCRLCDEPAELGDLCFECEDRAITDFTASPCPLFFDERDLQLFDVPEPV